MSASRICVTGANGFIGRAIMAAALARGDEVVGIDLHPNAERHVVAGDVSAPGAWAGALAGADVVIHTAALVSNLPTLDAAWTVNTLGTRNVLDAAVSAGVGRFVYLSSVRAFSDLGFPDNVTERHPVRPDGNPYVDTRVATEQVVLQAHAAGELPVTIIRPGDVYGPGSRPWTVLPVEMIAANQFVLPAMGKGIFSPVFIDDLVDGILLAAGAPPAAGHVFTLSGGVGVSCREFFGHYYRMLGKRGPICLPTPVALALARAATGAARVRGVETEANVVSMLYLTRTGTYSIQKARDLLGYAPSTDLDAGMAQVQAWLSEQGMLGAGG